MPTVKIVQYQFAFSEAEGFMYAIRTENTQKWSNWTKVSPETFTAMAMILKEEPVYLDSEHKMIRTNPEDIKP